MKPVTAWAVLDADGIIDLLSVRWTRGESIEAFRCQAFCRLTPWVVWRKRGCRAVRVRLVVEGGEDG